MFVILGATVLKRVTFLTPRAPIANGKECYVGQIRERTRKRLEGVDRLLGVEAIFVNGVEAGIWDDSRDKWAREAVDNGSVPQLPVFQSEKGYRSRPSRVKVAVVPKLIMLAYIE